MLRNKDVEISIEIDQCTNQVVNALTMIADKSLKFAIRIVKMYKYLSNEQREYIMSKQLLRSGTSIGANVREAQDGESRADFIHKMSIAQKECSETVYWLELLYATKYINKPQFSSIYQDATELKRILNSIILTTKQNRSKSNARNP